MIRSRKEFIMTLYERVKMLKDDLANVAKDRQQCADEYGDYDQAVIAIAYNNVVSLLEDILNEYAD